MADKRAESAVKVFGEYAYSVKRTVPSYPQDVAKEFVDTLTAAGLGTGFYYSTGECAAPRVAASLSSPLSTRPRPTA